MTEDSQQLLTQSTTGLSYGADQSNQCVVNLDSLSEVDLLRLFVLGLVEKTRQMEQLISELRACQCG